ncbi:MAG: metal ABC transporter permease [Planctomycetota bacterium]|jgi:manganese/iron transport system permease protein/iron/zinc/copper transport system permease protein
MIEQILNAIIEPLQETYFQKALLGGCFVAIVCGVTGCLVVLRKMSFLGDALSHAMIAGVAGGYLFMKMLFGIEAHAPAMLIGSLIAAVLTVALIGFVSKVSRIKEDSAIGIMYCGVFAAGIVVVSIFRNYIHIDLMHFIMGDVLGVSNEDLWASAATSALVLSIIILFFRHFQITSFDPVMAASIGLPVILIEYLLTTCVSLVVVSAVSMVGVILVVGLLITPAATAYLLCDRLDKMMGLAALFGVTSVVGGLYSCVFLDSAGGGAIMLFSTLQFLIVLIAAPEYGMLARWMRLRRMVPQQLLEDILSSLRKKDSANSSQIAADAADGKSITKAIAQMERDKLITVSNDIVSLTEQGRKEADRVKRAHRLWETYLEKVGEEEGSIHERAHTLEHISDAGAMEYLDEILEHPINDPHGSEIPQRDLSLYKEGELHLSILRGGRKCEVISAGISSLTKGERVTIEPREDNGKTWIVKNADNRTVRLNHKEADSVVVKIV